MPARKHYSGGFSDYEKKLERVMARLGVKEYNYDWTSSRGSSSCYVEMVYNGRVYRFENDIQKSAKYGCNRTCASDLFADVVYTLEGLARSVERGILELDMLMAGIPSLPPAVKVEPCLQVLGFDYTPSTFQEVKQRYWLLAQESHPDKTGSDNSERFQEIQTAYEQAKELFGEK